MHENAAPILIGKNVLDIERNWHSLVSFVGGKSTGIESRGRSAIDIAAWDIFGKVTGQPVYQLLGGKSRERVPIYNTCAGNTYTQRVSTTGHPSDDKGRGKTGRYEDYDAFMNRADELAIDLVEQGYKGMKIWPFDAFNPEPTTHYISPVDLKKGCEPFEKIRNAVGDQIEIMVEMHGRWDLRTAKQIARALEPYNPFWFEDPIVPYSIDSLADFASSTRICTAASEILGGLYSYRDLVESHAADIVIFDPTWTGGITEARKIIGLTEAHELAVAPHDCVGPLSYVVDTHLTTYAPNTVFQETTRAFYYGWYRNILTTLPTIKDGYVYPIEAPGLGTELLPDLVKRPDVCVRTTTAADL